MTGRKPISPTGERMKTRNIRLSDADWSRLKHLGGAAFVRAMLVLEDQYAKQVLNVVTQPEKMEQT